MPVSHVEVLVEEHSMEAALCVLLPRLLNDVSFEVYPYQGKNDLLRRLPDRLRGYSSWLPHDWRIMIIIDRDNNNCYELKELLEQASTSAGLITRSNAGGNSYQVVNRLAIEELEAWYFGDWPAVKAVFPKVPDTIPNQTKYRGSDAISGGTWEAFERILQRAGYHQMGLRKIEAARLIAEKWNPETNRSRSFNVFISAIQELARE